MNQEIIIRNLLMTDYQMAWDAMMRFNRQRDTATPDEIWCLEHPPVYTLGMAGKREHILRTSTIPIINSDRGGQVTYHGPGQLIVYLLLDLHRKQLRIKKLVTLIEQSIIDFCRLNDIDAERRTGAPGVYVAGQKLAALGIRVKKGCCYHGLALNVDMDLHPYNNINPCGYAGLQVTQLKDLGCELTLFDTAKLLLPCLLQNLGYTSQSTDNNNLRVLQNEPAIVTA